MTSCAHIDHIHITQLPESVEGCEDCLAAGDPWLHLRICLERGKVGCCDDSPNRHATAHAQASGHPLIRSLQPREDWCFCYLDEIGLLIPGVQGQTRIPALADGLLVAYPPDRGFDAPLLVVEVGEQVLAEGLEGVDDHLARLLAVVLREAPGGGFDGIDVIGDAAVLGLQPVDDRIEVGVGFAQLREKGGALGVVVGVHEAAKGSRSVAARPGCPA